MDAPPTATSARVDAVADDGPKTAPARKATMQTIVQDAYGSADVLELAAIDKPVPTDNQVLVAPEFIWELGIGIYLIVKGYRTSPGPRTPQRFSRASLVRSLPTQEPRPTSGHKSRRCPLVSTTLMVNTAS